MPRKSSSREIGLGIISYAHPHVPKYASAIAAHPQARLVGIAGRGTNAALAAEEAARYDTPYYDDYEDLLRDDELDGVYIGTEPNRHQEVISRVAAHGKHVLCDKPIALTLEEADEIIRLCREAGVRLMVPFNPRFQLPLMKVKSALESGEAGKLVAVFALKYGKLPTKIPGPADYDWLLDPRQAGGGGFLDIGIHAIDALRWLAGSEARRVYAGIGAMLQPDLPVDDLGMMTVEFDNGVVASLSAGWAPRRTGPGLTGALVLDYSGASFPALTARRTRPFRWPGRLDFLAPDNLLLRAGQVSRRNIRYQDPWGYRTREGRPWFFQWLLGWEVTSWFRTTFTHTVMAAAREGTLWPDLLQINFPLIGTTWREAESGPITDRLFAVQLEFRWRHAPWPLLPSTAGRIFWDYAGTDFLPSGPGGLIPEISIPASVAGCELVSPRWDLGFEYAETVHEKALWYSNGGYEEGYSHRSWLLGHPLGGAGESFTGLVRYRPAAWPLEAELKGRHAVWEHPLYIQGTGKRESVALAVGKRPESADGPAPGSPLLWQLTAEYVNEEAVPLVSMAQTRHWWRVYLKLGI